MFAVVSRVNFIFTVWSWTVAMPVFWAGGAVPLAVWSGFLPTGIGRKGIAEKEKGLYRAGEGRVMMIARVMRAIAETMVFALLPLAAAFLVSGCGGKPASAPPGSARVKLATEVVQPQVVPAERQLDGTVEAVDEATISAQTAGRITGLFFDVNDLVPAGAVIVRLRDAEQRAGLRQAEAARSEAAAGEAEAQARFVRIRDMYERKVVAQAQYEKALAGRDAAVARLAAASAALDSAREEVAHTEVRAPYAGILTARLVHIGESVVSGTPLVRSYSLERLRVVCDLPESLADRVRQLRKAAVYVDGRRIEAAAVTVFPEVDAATNTVRARLDLPAAAPAVYPGMFVKVGLVTGEQSRLLVPLSAIVTRSEVSAVYVVGPHERVALRQVRAGDAYGDRREILAGLAAGERVALDPLAALQAVEAPPGVAGAGGDG